MQRTLIDRCFSPLDRLLPFLPFVPCSLLSYALNPFLSHCASTIYHLSCFSRVLSLFFPHSSPFPLHASSPFSRSLFSRFSPFSLHNQDDNSNKENIPNRNPNPKISTTSQSMKTPVRAGFLAPSASPPPAFPAKRARPQSGLGKGVGGERGGKAERGGKGEKGESETALTPEQKHVLELVSAGNGFAMLSVFLLPFLASI